MKNANQDAKEIIKNLNTGKYFCECPCACGEINLKDADLFYDEDLTQSAIDSKKEMEVQYTELKNSLKHKRTYQTGKTKSVNLGLISEKIITTLDDFIQKGFKHADCRSIFKPIDFLIFEGLSETGRVTKILFTEVKTGDARLGQREKVIKEAVDKKQVKFETY